MPNIKSAMKRVRIEKKRMMRNKAVKATVKTYITHANKAIAGDMKDVDPQEAVGAAISALDRGAKKGVLHRNNAARRKSRLIKRLQKMQEQPAAPR